jgi:hypothetical protein
MNYGNINYCICIQVITRGTNHEIVDQITALEANANNKLEYSIQYQTCLAYEQSKFHKIGSKFVLTPSHLIWKKP